MRTSVAAAGFALLLGTACFAGVRGSGRLKTETRDVPEFDAVAVGAGIRATIAIGPRKPVRIEADDDLLPIIETKVRDGVLTIEFQSHESISSSHDIQVSIQTPELHGVMASGGAYVRAQLTRGQAAELDASGGGVIEAQGRADKAKIEISGGTQVLGAELDLRNLHIHGSGGSEANLRVSGKVRGSLSGGAELHLKGGATSQVTSHLSTSGGASVHFDD